MPRHFLIDTDTASDDAVALLMALRWPDVQVEAITIVSGNVPLDQGALNALYTVELCGASTPVYKGAARPLARDPVHAFFFHGRDGMGDMNYPPPRRACADGDAVDAIVERTRAHPGLGIVTLGPLTNVALALQRAPDMVSNVGRVVVMGGAACAVGNVTPAAEFNFWVDPEAARIVLHGGLPIEMVGWELCRGEANLTREEMAYVRSFDTPVAHLALDCNRTALEATRRQSADPGLGLPDPVAMAIALDPAVCTRRGRHHVTVETGSELTRGMSVVDALGVATDERNRAAWGEIVRRPPNVTVCWTIDAPRWKEMLYSVLR